MAWADERDAWWDDGETVRRPGLSAFGESLWLGLAAGLVGFWVGYGGSRSSTYPVRGWVLVGEEPAAGATVEFHALDSRGRIGTDRPTGRVREDGTFEVGTRSDSDGAPPGEYAVTVEWRPPLRAQKKLVVGPDAAPLDYSRPATTPLRATVKEGTNRLPPFWVEKRYP